MTNLNEHGSAAADRVIPSGLLAFALVFPTFTTWLYFVALAGYPASWQQGAYAVGKIVQFALPVVCVFVLRRAQLVWAVSTKGVWLGGMAGSAILLSMLLLYYQWLSPGAYFAGAQPLIQQKVTGIGINSRASFAVLALFYSIIHSGLEEYYWRWFVYRCLRERSSFATATVLSSLGFMAHHVLVLTTFFGWSSPLSYLFSMAVAVGGAIWAAVYERCRSLLGPWISHALVDAGIFWIGYELSKELLI